MIINTTTGLMILYEAANPSTIDGHGSSQIFLRTFKNTTSDYSLEECEQFNESFGIAATPAVEITADSVFADSTTVSGQ